MTEIKDCPFCGHQANLIELTDCYHIECKGCGISTHLASEDAVRVLWNARVHMAHEERIIGHRNGDEAVLVKVGDAPAVWYWRAKIDKQVHDMAFEAGAKWAREMDAVAPPVAQQWRFTQKYMDALTVVPDRPNPWRTLPDGQTPRHGAGMIEYRPLYAASQDTPAQPFASLIDDWSNKQVRDLWDRVVRVEGGKHIDIPQALRDFVRLSSSQAHRAPDAESKS